MSKPVFNQNVYHQSTHLPVAGKNEPSKATIIAAIFAASFFAAMVFGFKPVILGLLMIVMIKAAASCIKNANFEKRSSASWNEDRKVEPVKISKHPTTEDLLSSRQSKWPTVTVTNISQLD
jgi:hypothetical protein